MLLILQMMCELNGEVDAKDFAKRLLHWARHGIEELGDIGEDRQPKLPTTATFEPHCVPCKVQPLAHLKASSL